MNQMAGGRPSVYNTRIAPHIEKIITLRAAGFLYDDIASMINVAPSTLYKHKLEIEEFSESLKNADDELITTLEHSLYSLAKGTYKQVRKKTIYEADGLTPKLVEVTEEYGKPELGAVIFALTNKDNDHWKNKQDFSMNGRIDTDIEVPSFADEFKRMMKEQYANTDK